MAAAKAAENHGDEWGLTWYLQWGMYTSISAWIHSQDSLAAAEAEAEDILPYNISQIITKTIPISTKIVISYMMKRGIPFWVWWKVNGNWDKTWSEFPNGGKVIIEQILAAKDRNKSKRARLTVTVIDPSRKVNHLSKFILDRKIITKFTSSISSIRIG